MYKIDRRGGLGGVQKSFSRNIPSLLDLNNIYYLVLMGSFSTYFISQPSLKCLEKLFFVIQEIYRPGTAISHASNLCIAVGGDQYKEFRGNASFLGERAQRVE